MDLQAHYNLLFKQASQNILAGKYFIDPQLDSTTDSRFGITLLIRPPEQTREKIQNFLNELYAIEPDQYYYPSSDIHITVLSIISCYQGFNVASISVKDYVSLIKESLQQLGSFEIHFKGITASPGAIMVQGFPADDTLDKIRDNLRTNFRNSELEQTIDKRYSIATAHTTVARFRQPLQDSQKLVNLLTNYRNYDFGSFIVDELELVYNDWYQRANKVKQLHHFRLN